MAKSIKLNNFNLPPILIQPKKKSLSNFHQNNIQTSFQFNVNKSLFKLNEQVFVLNKCKLDNFDTNYNAYLTISQLLNNLYTFENQQRLDLINWNIFRGLVGLFVDLIKTYSNNYKILSMNSQLLDNISNLNTKKTFDQLSQDIKHIIICSNTIKILYILVINSKELKTKLEDLDGLHVLIKLINDDSFVNNNEKHKCLEPTLLMIYNLSIEYKKKSPIEYGHVLLKFNKLDDVTAYIRCKSVLNLFPHNESFEERIGTKVSLFLKLLKKSYASPIKAEINSIFFIYSALKEVKYKSKLVKLILDENCLQIFLIKLSELSFVCSKFIYPQNNHNLDQKLLPYFDSNQNMNNSYRTIYYSYVFYQLLYLNSDSYKKLPSKAKYCVTKSLSSFLTNKEFLKNYSTKCSSTIIDLEKCLLCVHTLNENTNNDFDINVFDILFNIGIHYETCAKESFLILSKIKSSEKLNKTIQKLIAYLTEESHQISNIFSSSKIYSCLFLLYTLLEDKINKNYDYDLDNGFDKAILNDKYQQLISEIINHGIENLNFKNQINLEKYLNNSNSPKESRQTAIIYYFINLNWFIFNRNLTSKIDTNQINDFDIIFDTFINIISSQSFNNNFQFKTTQSIINLIKLDFDKKLLKINTNKIEQFNHILNELNSDITDSMPAVQTTAGNSSRLASCPSSRSKKEPFLKCLIIDDLITIIVRLIEYDPANYLNLYLKFVETHLIDLKFKSFKSENLIKIYHFKEKEYFHAYTKYKLTSTYNLLILSEYFRNNHNHYSNVETSYKLIQNLKQLFINDDIYLVEKKYIIDLIINMILNDHVQIDTIRGDSNFIDKLKNLIPASSARSSSMSASINLKNEINSRSKEPSKISLRKLLSQTCQELNWLLSDDFYFNFNSNDSKQMFTQLLTHDKNVLIIYSLDCINDCYKIRDELEKHNYKCTIDTYDDFCDMNTNEKNNLERIKKSIQDNTTVLICLNDNYKKSKYGIMRAKYGYFKQKVIIPIIVKKNLMLNDWLKYMNKNENKSNLIDQNDYENYNDFIAKLLSTIKNPGIKYIPIRNYSTSTAIPSRTQLITFKTISISSLTISNNNNNTLEIETAAESDIF
jgi:hypothetical protein